MSYAANKKWRLRYPDRRNSQKKRYYKKTAVGAKNSRIKWTTKEIDSIIASNKPRDTVLAKKLGRSVEAIQVKRSKIKAR